MYVWSALVASIAASASSGYGNLDAGKYMHVVVIPDLHGDKDAFLRSLWIAHAQIDIPPVGFHTFESRFMEATVD